MMDYKIRDVRATGAEFCVAGDNSCLMHIGGGLSRARAGVRTIHLAEVLARTERVADAPHRNDSASAAHSSRAPQGPAG